MHLLEVIEAPNHYGVPIETRTNLERDLERVLVASRVSDVEVAISLRQGNVVQEILAQAKASRSDLVVIGSHGRGGAAANHAVTYAKRLAKEANAKLILMTAVEWPLGDGVTSGRVGELRTSIEAKAREALGRLLTRPGSDIRLAEAVVTSGKASAAIIKLARLRSVDLIVMGVSGRSALDVALLGSTTHQVIREGAWPVLTVPAVKR